MTKTIAVVLSGAVAQGAFEAGALAVLVEKDVAITRIVSASAGSLNAVALATGVRGKNVAAMTQKIIELWREHADWYDVFHLNPLKWFPFRGLSDQKKLLKLLVDNVAPAAKIAGAPAILLRMIVAPLGGRDGAIDGPDGRPMTTYERMIEFKDADFEDAATLGRICEVAVASAAFPGVFAPYDLGMVGKQEVGPCIDGGSTNNTPIQYALDAPESLDAIVVINPTVATGDPLDSSALEGVGLASQIVQMLINERLYRDLYAVVRANRQLQNLMKLVDNKTLDAAQYNAVLGALAVSDSPLVLPRIANIVQIRPESPLPGNAFSGFRSQKDREAYIAAGQARAEDQLKGW